jgi:hypothetical protein
MKTFLIPTLCLALILSLSARTQAQSAPESTLRAACYPIQASLRCRLFFDNPTGQPVTVRIRDEKGQVQYSERFADRAKFNRAYDLAPLGDGTYTFEVRQGRTVWRQPLRVATVLHTDRQLALVPNAQQPAPTPRVELARHP